MKFTMNLIMAGVAAMTLAAGGALLDGPSEADVEQFIADDLQAARRDELRMTLMVKRCHQELGPSADLVQIAGTDHFACREMPIEPTPASVLHKYAQLGEKK